MRVMKRNIRFFFQRLFRGWDDSDTWSLDHTLAKFTLPRLRRFKKIAPITPMGLDESKWQEMLDKMIFAMEHHARGSWTECEDYAKVQEGLELFGKHFRSLWW